MSKADGVVVALDKDKKFLLLILQLSSMLHSKKSNSFSLYLSWPELRANIIIKVTGILYLTI
ncbi:MAG: hypothetical protein WCF23_18265 [Candidatus Nitrosopolaris sp.]